MKIKQKIIGTTVVLATFLVGIFFVVLFFSDVNISKKNFLTKVKQNHWKIFVGTNKGAFFLDFKGKHNQIFSSDNIISEVSLFSNRQKLAFLENKELNGDSHYYLTVVDINGDHKKSIKLNGAVKHILWSPKNENEIAFLSDYQYDSESYNLYVFDFIDNSRKNIVKNLVSAIETPTFSWSPNGEKIVFTSTKGKIMVVNKDGSGLHAMHDDEGTVVSWSPNNEFIAYKQGRSFVKEFTDGSMKYGRTGNGKYYIFDIKNKNKEKIFADKNVYSQPVWSPDGKYTLLHKEYDMNFKTDFWVTDVKKKKIIYRFKSNLRPISVSWVEGDNKK